MTNTLRHQALGALAVALEAQPQIALDRAAQLQDRGWRFEQNRTSIPMLRLRHPRSFYRVNLHTNGDAEFRLSRLRQPHRISAQEADGFESYLDAIDRGEQHGPRWAKWFLVGAL